MSAPVLRRPPRPAGVAWEYARVLASYAALVAFAILLVCWVSASGWSDPYTGAPADRADDRLMEAARGMAMVAAFLPGWMSRGETGLRAFERPLPLAPHLQALLRSAAVLPFALAAFVGGIAIQWTMALEVARKPGFSLLAFADWYPAAVLSACLTLYLLGTAAHVLVRNPARLILTCLLLGPMLLSLAPALRGGAAFVGLASNPDVVEKVGEAAWQGAASAWLVTSAGITALAVFAPRWQPKLASGVAGRTWRHLRSALAGALPASGVRFRAGPARPTRFRSALRAQLSVTGHRMAFPGAVSLFVTRAAFVAASAPRSPSRRWGLDDLAPLAAILVCAFTVRVWRPASAAEPEHQAALPVEHTAGLLAQVCSGACWLLLLSLPPMAALAAGLARREPLDLANLGWLRVALSGLCLYLAATLFYMRASSTVVESVRFFCACVVVFWLGVFLEMRGVRVDPGSWYPPFFWMWRVARANAGPWPLPTLAWLAALGAAVAFRARRAAHAQRRYGPGRAAPSRIVLTEP